VLKLYIANDQGELMLAVENLDGYNLSKPVARQELVDEIKHAVEIFATRNA